MKNILSLGVLVLFAVACQKKVQTQECVDRSLIQDVFCTADYTPVCGCDGQTYSNECVARNHYGISEFSEGACGCAYQEQGLVKDMTGLDGCGLMIEMLNGDLLEPLKIPEGFNLIDGMPIEFDWRAVTHISSNCMAGTLAEITCIRERQNCGAEIPLFSFNEGADYQDLVGILEAEINGNCLEISYGLGGCDSKNQRAALRALPMFCGTPPHPPTTFEMILKNDQFCQVYFTRTESFDLTQIQEAGKSEVRFILSDKQNFNQHFTYSY